MLRGLNRMALPTFETVKYICSECKSTRSKQKDKNGNPRWYRNKQKGIGFLCKTCYYRQYLGRYERSYNKKNKGVVSTDTI